MIPQTDLPAKFLSVRQVMAITSLSKPTIYKLMAAGSFPKPIRISPNRVAWSDATLAAWIAAKASEAA